MAIKNYESLKKLRVDGRRLRQTIEASAAIGATEGGGLNRVTCSDEDKQGRDMLVGWYKEAGCEVKIDQMGNIFAIRPGRNRDLGAVLSGSHFDTQRPGGRFDGILGVLAPLEAVRVLNDNNVVTERDVIITDWTNEEGAWFAPACMGSGVWTGNITQKWAYSQPNRRGESSFGEELGRIGYKGDLPCDHKQWNLYAAYELHIEQGPILHREKIQIGAPKGILCLHWYDVFVEGTANQVGPTPMAGRNDALLAFAEMCQVVNQVALQLGDMVATVAAVDVKPNIRNIIADKVYFAVDIRAWDDNLALQAWDMMKKEFEVIAARRSCPIRCENFWKVEHAPFDAALHDRVVETAEELGYSARRMVSGAGHDMSEVNKVTRGAMLFVPSTNGRSHCEVEDTSWDDCEKGANVLLHCLLKTANEI